MQIISNQKHFNSKLKMERISAANNSPVTVNPVVLSSGKHLARLLHVLNPTETQALGQLIQVSDPQRL